MYPALVFTAAAILTAASGINSAFATASLPPEVAQLAADCAPDVHPSTMQNVIYTESRGNRLAINVNGGHRLARQPQTEDEAIETVQWLSHQGYNFDVGYAQVNSSNFESLGVSAQSLFNGCTNLRAGATILAQCYARAVKQVGEGQQALKQALSCYNTGSLSRGFDNGYVSKVVTAANTLQVPALQPTTTPAQAKPQVADTAQDEPENAPMISNEGEPGAFGSPDSDAFTSQSSTTDESSNSGEQSDNGVFDSKEATDGGTPKKQNHENGNSLLGPEAVDSSFSDQGNHG